MTLAVDKNTQLKFTPKFKIGDFIAVEDPGTIKIDNEICCCTRINYWYIHAYQISTRFFVDGSSYQSVEYLLDDHFPDAATTEIVDDLLVSSHNKYTPEACIRQTCLSETQLSELSSKLDQKLSELNSKLDRKFDLRFSNSLHLNRCYELIAKLANLNLEQKQEFLNYWRGYRIYKKTE